MTPLSDLRLILPDSTPLPLVSVEEGGGGVVANWSMTSLRVPWTHGGHVASQIRKTTITMVMMKMTMVLQETALYQHYVLVFHTVDPKRV